MDSTIETQLVPKAPNKAPTSADGYPPNPHLEQPAWLEGWRPRLTGFQLLYIVFTAGFGLTKASLAYRGYSTAPTTLDWLYGVVAFLSFYWIGLYDKYSSRRIPSLFERNYLSFQSGVSNHVQLGS